jgi:hypothetical protein
MRFDSNVAPHVAQPFNSIIFAAGDEPLMSSLRAELERQETRDKQLFSSPSRRLRARATIAAEQLALVLAGWPVPNFPGSAGAVVIGRHGGRAYVVVPSTDLLRLASMTDDEIVAALDGAGRAWCEASLADWPYLADAVGNGFNSDAAGGRSK